MSLKILRQDKGIEIFLAQPKNLNLFELSY